MDQRIKEQYDRLAESYDRRWRAYVSGTLTFLTGWVSLSGDERVLDVACGTGELERMLLSEHPALSVVGVDISEKMLNVARGKHAAHENASFREGNAGELPFPGAGFDLVVTANSFHYFGDPIASLREMRRVLRPGGRAVVLDWCRDFLACQVCDVALKALDPAYQRCYNQRELREMMSAAGFDVVAERTARVKVIWGLMVADGVSPTPPATA